MDRYSGIIAASFAYIIWGVLPIYWKALQTVPALEILCHRMTWSLFVTLGIILFARRTAEFRHALANRRNLGIFGASALLLAVNWLIYIWAVNAGYILEASLGYFINPLISVVFGVFFFKERLRSGQIAALVLVVAGVLYLTVYYGRFPWIALSLSVTFAIYGLLHKISSLPSMDALGIEVLLFFLPAAAPSSAARRRPRSCWSGPASSPPFPCSSSASPPKRFRCRPWDCSSTWRRPSTSSSASCSITRSFRGSG
jgi:chloramphenicol-sensitive protein RarD